MSVGVIDIGGGVGFELVSGFRVVIEVKFTVDDLEYFRVSPGNLAGSS